MRRAIWGTLACLAVVPWPALADDVREEAARALRKAVQYHVEKVAVEGGYVFFTTADLKRRAGEEPVTATQVWIQPPATPAVGLAYLTAYEATGERYYLDAAVATARCLVRGQLRSGGWYVLIEFDPKLRARHAYRVEPASESARNMTTLDDDKSQSCMRLLMRVDKALEFKDAAIHEASLYALDHLVGAQYPNGAWPQQFNAPPDPNEFPVKPASYPETWSRTWPAENYVRRYTFNDNAMGDCIEVLLEAAETYHQPRYRESAEKCGDFMILAQMPDPQPAWAQQYDVDMHPAWARKFEPPSITAGESQSIVESLLLLYRETGESRFLKPIPKALDWLEKSRLPGGQVARFYELKTNKPLYFTKDYQLTYSDADMPTHYSFKTGAGKVDRLRRDYERLRAMSAEGLARERNKTRKVPPPSESQIAQAKAVIRALDEQGRWLQTGRLEQFAADEPDVPIIRSDTFIKNVQTLSQYLAAARAAGRQ